MENKVNNNLHLAHYDASNNAFIKNEGNQITIARIRNKNIDPMM
jgi:hypothetical protein